MVKFPKYLKGMFHNEDKYDRDKSVRIYGVNMVLLCSKPHSSMLFISLFKDALFCEKLRFRVYYCCMDVLSK